MSVALVMLGIAEGLPGGGASNLGLGVFLFPILEDSIGNSALLYLIAGGCVLGLTVTLLFRVEPKGKSLEELTGSVPARPAVEAALA